MANAERTEARDGPSKPEPSAGAAPLAPAKGLGTLHLWQIQSVRDVLVIGAIAGTVWAGYALRTVTVPLLIALALAYLFEPVVARMSAWRFMNRPLAVGLILSMLAGVLSVGAAVMVPLAVGQTLSFAESLRSGKYDGFVEKAMTVVPEEYRADARDWVDRVIHPSSRAPAGEVASRDADSRETGIGDAEAGADAPAPPPRGGSDEPSVATRPQEAAGSAREGARAESGAETGDGAAAARAGREPSVLPKLPESVTQVSLDNPIVSLLGAGAGQVYAFALRLLQLGLVAFLIPFYFYYFSVHWPGIVGFFARLVPDEHSSSVSSVVSEMDRAVAGFVRGRIVICTIMGVMFAIGWQVCGVPYGIALGLLTGAFSIVPYLGGIGLPFAVLLLAADQFALDPSQRMAMWGILVWPTVVFIVVQSIEGYLLTPVIAGKATNLDPVTIVVAILAGGSIAGVYGMLLAIPIAACGKIAARRLLLPRIQDWARGKARDPLPIDHD